MNILNNNLPTEIKNNKDVTPAESLLLNVCSALTLSVVISRDFINTVFSKTVSWLLFLVCDNTVKQFLHIFIIFLPQMEIYSI